MTGNADIGLIGLAVMGRNLALNLADHGFAVAVYNRSPERTEAFLAGPASATSIVGADSLGDLVAMIERPRRILLMVKAGPSVDEQIDSLLPHLDTGDIIIDGGNSHYEDTERRLARLAPHGIRYVGAGISGGEDGARHGPSIMPGGDEAAWERIGPLLTAVAARANGEPCCAWLGPGGAGHFVKMVHNGIEYGDMQVIAEAYDVLRRGLGLEAPDIREVFTGWNEGRLDSFLIGLTANVLGTLDDDGAPLIDRVLDAAGQKGTGRWTVDASMEMGVPTTLVAEAVAARMVSALVDERVAAAARFAGGVAPIDADKGAVIADLEDAVYASKIVSYAQGFMLLEAASVDRGWNLDHGTVASLWRAGCIIRSRFLGDIAAAYRGDPRLSNLLLAPFFVDALAAAEPGWRRTVERAVAAGIPVPAFSSALAFFDGYRSPRLPANLIQAQRDAFGAHTYERLDRERGQIFHSSWSPS
jgi:6-phosphogluconate dehydrogenase